MRTCQSIFYGFRHWVGFCPDDIISKYPSIIFEGYCYLCGDKHEGFIIILVPHVQPKGAGGFEDAANFPEDVSELFDVFVECRLLTDLVGNVAIVAQTQGIRRRGDAAVDRCVREGWQDVAAIAGEDHLDALHKITLTAVIGCGSAGNPRENYLFGC